MDPRQDSQITGDVWLALPGHDGIQHRPNLAHAQHRHRPNRLLGLGPLALQLHGIELVSLVAVGDRQLLPGLRDLVQQRQALVKLLPDVRRPGQAQFGVRGSALHQQCQALPTGCNDGNGPTGRQLCTQRALLSQQGGRGLQTLAHTAGIIAQHKAPIPARRLGQRAGEYTHGAAHPSRQWLSGQVNGGCQPPIRRRHRLACGLHRPSCGHQALLPAG